MGVTNKRTITKTRRKTRDIDQIKADLLSPKHLAQWKETRAAEDLPSLGQFYCVECAKWLDSQRNLEDHRKGKPHRRRIKQLREEPITQKEDGAAVGIWGDKGGPSKPSQADEDIAMSGDSLSTKVS